MASPDPSLDLDPHARPVALEPLLVRRRRGEAVPPVTEIPERPVVDRLPALVAPRGVCDVPFPELPDVPGDDLVQEERGVLPADAVLVQGGDVDEPRGVPDRVILHVRHDRIRTRSQVPRPRLPLPALTR